MNITYEFACRDDCLDNMVPSDLRALVVERDKLLAENKRLKSLLVDWQEFAKDVTAGDAAGQNRLDGLRGRTQAALEQKA